MRPAKLLDGATGEEAEAVEWLGAGGSMDREKWGEVLRLERSTRKLIADALC